MPEHDELAPLIPWYANGTLDPQDRAAVESHLPSCADCREALELARSVREVASSISASRLREHVDETLLRDLVFEAHLVEQTVRARAEGHMDVCDECAKARDELVALQRELDDADGTRTSFWAGFLTAIRTVLASMLRTPGLSPALAAAAVFALLAVPAYRGLQELPAMRSQVEELKADSARLHAAADQAAQARDELERRLQQEAASSGGWLDVAYLSGPARGPDRRETTIRIEPGQRFVALAPTLDAESLPGPAGRLRVEVRRGADLIWSTEIESEAARSRVRSAQGAPIALLPSSLFTTGTYSVLVTPEQDANRRLFEAEFRVLPPATRPAAPSR